MDRKWLRISRVGNEWSQEVTDMVSVAEVGGRAFGSRAVPELQF